MKRLFLGVLAVLVLGVGSVAYAQRAAGTVVISRVTCDSDGERFPNVPVRLFHFKNPGSTTVYVSTAGGLAFTANSNYPAFATNEGMNDIFTSNMNSMACKTASGTQILNLVGERL